MERPVVSTTFLGYIMAKLDDDIKEAEDQLRYYFRNRQKNLDNRKKFDYYNERCMVKEERLAKLLNKRVKRNGKKA